MRTLKIIIPWIMGMIMFSGCQKPQSLWQEGTISVMADDSDWEAVQGVLKYTYEKVVRTPQDEKEFVLYHVPDSLLSNYTRSHFLMIVSTLKSEGPVGEMVKDLVSDPKLRKSIEDGNNFVFIRHNQWARDQMMIILIGKDLPGLREKIENYSMMLYDLVYHEMKDYLHREVLENRENKQITEHLMDRYSWTMTLQKDFFIAQEFPEDNFLWMQRKMPDRWIFVRWINGGDTSLLHQEWVVNERDLIGKTYYQNFTERVNQRYLFSRKGSFLNRPALITTGLWERIDDTAGGPFKNYTFYDASTERVYMIDLALFAPGKEKMPFLRRMEVIAETFRTRFDPES